VHSFAHQLAHALHFAISVFSTAGIAVMALLVREIINQLEHVLPQKCGPVLGMVPDYPCLIPLAF
jgi:hypothetical protein